MVEESVGSDCAPRSCDRQTELVKVLVAPEDKKRWQAIAKRAGLSLSEYVRRRVDNHRVPLAPSQAERNAWAAIGQIKVQLDMARLTLQDDGDISGAIACLKVATGVCERAETEIVGTEEVE